MPYHGLIVYIQLKRFSRLEIYHRYIESLQRRNPTSLTGGGRGFSSKFAFVRIFRKIFGCLVASVTVLF